MASYPKGTVVYQPMGWAQFGKPRLMIVESLHLDSIQGQYYTCQYIKSGVQMKFTHSEIKRYEENTAPPNPPGSSPPSESSPPPGDALVKVEVKDGVIDEMAGSSPPPGDGLVKVEVKDGVMDEMAWSSDPDWPGSQESSEACLRMDTDRESQMLEINNNKDSAHTHHKARPDQELVETSNMENMVLMQEEDLNGLTTKVELKPVKPELAQVENLNENSGPVLSGSQAFPDSDQGLVETSKVLKQEVDLTGLTAKVEIQGDKPELLQVTQDPGLTPVPVSKAGFAAKAEKVEVNMDDELLQTTPRPAQNHTDDSTTSALHRPGGDTAAKPAPLSGLTKNPDLPTKPNSLRLGLMAARLACLKVGREMAIGSTLERSTSTPTYSQYSDKENIDPYQTTFAQLLNSVSSPQKPTRPDTSRLHKPTQDKSRIMDPQPGGEGPEGGQVADQTVLDSRSVDLANQVNNQAEPDNHTSSSLKMLEQNQDSEFSDPYPSTSNKLPRMKKFTKKKKSRSTKVKSTLANVLSKPCGQELPIPNLTDDEDSEDSESEDFQNDKKHLKPLPISEPSTFARSALLPPPARKKTKRSQPADQDSVTPAKHAKIIGTTNIEPDRPMPTKDMQTKHKQTNHKQTKHKQTKHMQKHMQTENKQPKLKPKQKPKQPNHKQPKQPKQKNSEADIPVNPLNFTVTNQAGEELEFGTKEFNNLFGEAEKLTDTTRKAYNLEFDRFVRFSKHNSGAAKVEKMLASTLHPTDVSNMVSTFIQSRINVREWKDHGVRKFLDTTTMDLIWQQLVGVFKQKTTYDLWSKNFQGARNARATYMKNSKKVAGNGELQNQPEPLTRAQISFLLHSDQLNLFTPRGLLTTFYILFTLIFLPRVRTEVRNVTRGDFQFLRNPDGSVRAVVYCPKGQLKRDRGHVRGSNSARVFKRPIALPCPGEPKLSFDIVLETLFAHLDMLEWSGPRSEQPLLYQMMKVTPPPGSCFFINRPLGVRTFDELFRHLIWNCGLKVNDLQYQNQSLRPTAFGFHRKLGLSTGQFMALAGHASRRTHIIYTRRNIELKGEAAGNFQEYMSDVAVERPNLEMVELEDRVTGRTEIRQVPDFLPLVVNGKQEGLFPISGMTAREIKRHLPLLEIVDEDDDDNDVADTFVMENDSEEEEADEEQDGPHAGGSGLVPAQQDLGPVVDDQQPSSVLSKTTSSLSAGLSSASSSRTPKARPRDLTSAQQDQGSRVNFQKPSSVPSKPTSGVSARANPMTPPARSRTLACAQQATSAPAGCSSAKFGRPFSTTRADSSPMIEQQDSVSNTTPLSTVERTRFNFKPSKVVLTDRLPRTMPSLNTTLAFQQETPLDLSRK